MWKNTFHFGLLVGGAFVLASLLFYMKGQPVSVNPKLTSINYFLALTGIFFGVRQFRDTILGGQISYGMAVGAGVLILFIASIIFTLYTYLLIAFFDPAILEEFLSIVQENYKKAGLSGEPLEQVMGLYKTVTPGIFAFAEIFKKTFMGLIFSLILAVFLKKNTNLLNTHSIDKFDETNNR